MFVDRLPVRGPTSRKSVSEAKARSWIEGQGGEPRGKPAHAHSRSAATRRRRCNDRVVGATLQSRPRAPTKHADAAKTTEPARTTDDQRAEPTPRSTGTNDLLAFLTFVEHHKPGSSVNAIVENYSSHGAYVRIGDVKGTYR